MNYKKVLNPISSILITIGFIGFIGGFAISMRLVGFELEVPLGDPGGIVVSQDGRIYLGLQFYGKIQSYDRAGNFIQNWNVANSGGAFRMEIKNDTILVATARGGYLLKYDLDGNQLSQQDAGGLYSEFENSNQFDDRPNNSVYKINNGLFPVVTKQNRGQNEKIISMPTILKIFKGPMPAWLFIAFGVILRFLLNRDEMMRRMNRFNKNQ